MWHLFKTLSLENKSFFKYPTHNTAALYQSGSPCVSCTRVLWHYGSSCRWGRSHACDVTAIWTMPGSLSSLFFSLCEMGCIMVFYVWHHVCARERLHVISLPYSYLIRRPERCGLLLVLAALAGAHCHLFFPHPQCLQVQRGIHRGHCGRANRQLRAQPMVFGIVDVLPCGRHQRARIQSSVLQYSDIPVFKPQMKTLFEILLAAHNSFTESSQLMTWAELILVR